MRMLASALLAGLMASFTSRASAPGQGPTSTAPRFTSVIQGVTATTLYASWSPNGRTFVFPGVPPDAGVQHGRPGPAVMVLGSRAQPLPLTSVLRRFPGRKKAQAVVWSAEWLSDQRLLLQIGRYQSSEEENATRFLAVNLDGSNVQHVATSAEEAVASVSPDRRQVAVVQHYLSLDRADPFSWASLDDREYWWWVLPRRDPSSSNVALGGFMVELASLRVRPPRSGRYYLWELGGFDATRLFESVKRPIVDPSYLPKARAVGFWLPPSIPQGSENDAWTRYWTRGHHELGISPLNMGGWKKRTVSFPPSLKPFDYVLHSQERRYRFVWSVDGRYLYLRHVERPELWTLELASGKATLLVSDLPGRPTMVWPSPDGSRLIVGYEGEETQKAGLVLVRLNTSRRLDR